MAYAFDIRDLFKSYDKVKALEGVTLKADEGTVFGLLGPNGAGKTTIVKILSTLLDFEKGKAFVHDIDVRRNPERVREIIGLAGQYAAVDEYLTGYENVFMTARLYGLSRKESKLRTQQLLDRLSLTGAANRQVKTYSGGMRRRLDLGASLVGHPKILFLDEPTTGLDPATRLEMWHIIRDLVREGTSILLTTQYLEEADELASRIAVVNKGKVIAEGTSDELKNQLGGDIVEFQLENAKDEQRALEVVKKFAKSTPSFNSDDLLVSIPVKDGTKGLMGVVQALNESKLPVETLSLHRPSLDDVFLSLTGAKIASKANATIKKGES